MLMFLLSPLSPRRACDLIAVPAAAATVVAAAAAAAATVVAAAAATVVASTAAAAATVVIAATWVLKTTRCETSLGLKSVNAGHTALTKQARACNGGSNHDDDDNDNFLPGDIPKN